MGLANRYKYVTGIECSKCEARIWSRHRHDFRHCPCGAVHVDGGRDYLKFGWETGMEIPKRVRIRVYQLDKDAGYLRWDK